MWMTQSQKAELYKKTYAESYIFPCEEGRGMSCGGPQGASSADSDLHTLPHLPAAGKKYAIHISEDWGDYGTGGATS